MVITESVIIIISLAISMTILAMATSVVTTSVARMAVIP
jgi:hypothetical protein